MNKTIQLKQKIPVKMKGQRLDRTAALCFPEYSRAVLQQWIKTGALSINSQTQCPKYKVKGNETITIYTQLQEQGQWQAEKIPLIIIYEDEEILVINKPANLVVHPAAGNHNGTLLNGLLHYYPKLTTLPRAGIVHRLDKNTTGLMVIAKTLVAHHALINQLQTRTMGREYEALVRGRIIAGGCISQPIGRHSVNRLKMSVKSNGKEAITHYKVLQHFRAHTHLHLKLQTGRTHQIRVHMAHLHFPIIGDSLYEGRPYQPKGCSETLKKQILNFNRQALHAKKLRLFHPVLKQYLEWEATAPDDFIILLDNLKKDLIDTVI